MVRKIVNIFMLYLVRRTTFNSLYYLYTTCAVLHIYMEYEGAFSGTKPYEHSGLILVHFIQLLIILVIICLGNDRTALLQSFNNLK